MNWSELLAQLAAPFPSHLIQWRAGAISRDRKRAQALPYVDPREYEKRLDKLLPGQWACAFKPWGEHRVICELTLAGVTRSSTGEENEGFAPGTSAEAQAFKRACSKFGLGRHLYEINTPWVAYDDKKRELTEIPRVDAPQSADTPTRTKTKQSDKSLPWQRWKTPDDAILWADEWANPETGEKLFNAPKHAQNSYNKAKREYMNSLPQGDTGTARDFWKYWYTKIEARKKGEDYVLPAHGSQELFEPIQPDEATSFNDLN